MREALICQLVGRTVTIEFESNEDRDFAIDAVNALDPERLKTSVLAPTRCAGLDVPWLEELLSQWFTIRREDRPCVK